VLEPLEWLLQRGVICKGELLERSDHFPRVSAHTIEPQEHGDCLIGPFFTLPKDVVFTNAPGVLFFAATKLPVDLAAHHELQLPVHTARRKITMETRAYDVVAVSYVAAEAADHYVGFAAFYHGELEWRHHFGQSPDGEPARVVAASPITHAGAVADKDCIVVLVRHS
jgi:hypothetical protein